MQTAYQPGTAYNPNVKQVFWTGVWAGVPAKVSLQFSRDSEALARYKFCVEVTAETVSQAAFFLILRAAILVLTKSPALIPAIARLGALLVGSPLLQSVGNGGTNSTDDTRYVQLLLNDWLDRRALPVLVVDGVAGQATTAAIVLFQQNETGGSDGRVDVGGAAVAALERLHVDSFAERVDAAFADEEHRAQLDELELTTVLSVPADPEQLAGEEVALDPVDVLRAGVDDYLTRLHGEIVELH